MAESRSILCETIHSEPDEGNRESLEVFSPVLTSASKRLLHPFSWLRTAGSFGVFLLSQKLLKRKPFKTSDSRPDQTLISSNSDHPSGSFMVDCSHLHMTYHNRADQVNALQDVSFTLSKGESLCIMGKSGCGKTTLLQIIGGLLQPDSGFVFTNGINPYRLKPSALLKFRREQTAFIFQSDNLIEEMTVRENLLFARKMRKISQDEKFLNELTRSMEMDHLLDRYPKELSIGQQQIAAIVRAVYQKTPILLADEPTGNLDRTSAELVASMLKEAQQRYHQTVFVVSHDPHFARIFDRILYMEDGRICFETQKASNS